MGIFQETGKLEIGVNFWGSKHGIRMWREWEPESIKADLEHLAGAGIRLLRVFPDWSYFQPIETVRGYTNAPRGLSIDGGLTLLHDKDETSGLNEEAFAAFSDFLDMAEANGIRVIPSILTGWMSGRMFAPPTLSDTNLITDPRALKQELRFIRAFVRRFRERTCIAAWCIGNECNCMGKVDSAEAAWLWSAAVTDAIKALDQTRPVLSGMHSLSTPGDGCWTIEDQAENCDVLTTHPYGSPTYKSDIDPINTIRPLLHPAAQTLLYRGIGGKPCMIEETGTFGELYADEAATADYIRCCLYSAWAYDCRGYLWWIAFDQGDLTYYPFYTNNRASNYGVMTKNRSAKPRLKEFQDFQRFLTAFGQPLPARITDGVCILSRGQKSWPAAYNAFLLARQAGLDLEYTFADEPLPDSNLYILPSLLGAESIRADMLRDLMERVAKGAILYVSTGTGLLRNLGRDFGVHIHTRYARLSDGFITMADGIKLEINSSVEYDLIPNGATVLATDSEGKPAYVSADYGKGKVFWLTRAVEHVLFEKPGVYHTENAAPYYEIYRAFAKECQTQKLASIDSPMIGMTEHILNQNERLLVCINYSPKAVDAVITLADDPKQFSVLHGAGALQTTAAGYGITISPNQALILKIKL